MQDFQGDQYISIDEAVSRVRDELPSLIHLVRDRVNTISQTRSELNGLLKHVDLEKAKTMDRVRVEFNQFELFLKKRLQQVESMIEDEVGSLGWAAMPPWVCSQAPRGGWNVNLLTCVLRKQSMRGM